jgi:hypothetical protein
LALMLVIATWGDFAAGDTSVDTGGEFVKRTFCVGVSHRKSESLSHAGQFATSISVGLGPIKGEFNGHNDS